MNIKHIEMERNEKYVAFATETPGTVYGRLCSLSLPFLQDLWWEYHEAWERTDTPEHKRITIWVHLQVLTTILVDRYGWNSTTRRPWKSKPYSTEVTVVPGKKSFKEYAVGSSDWTSHWKHYPEDQLDMLEWMKKHSTPDLASEKQM